MRYLVVLAALLVTPIAADADLVQDSRDTAVEVTISVVGMVPLAGGDLVLDDTFDLKGTGSAFIRLFTPPPFLVTFRSLQEASFNVSGGGTSAGGFVGEEETIFSVTGFASFSLDTPLYSLGFFHSNPANFSISMGVPIGGVSFSARSDEARVTVGGENSFLVGTASFSGTGVAVPEPGATTLLLVLGVTAIAVWRRRGE